MDDQKARAAHRGGRQITARDTIVAVATANGAAGVGIVRLSGSCSRSIAETLCARRLRDRRASHHRFLDADGDVIDDGIAILYLAPRSYTGEDVVELQAHGNPIVLARLQRRCLALGARAARPGEFTERAFLEGRIDLAQAEAVADLISAGSEAAAQAARRSLDGEFSRRVDALVEQLTQLRVHIEAALDFPDEEIDFLAAPELRARVVSVTAALVHLLREATQGKRLVDGLHVVIVGAPNTGKSSLLNALAAEDRAIVSPVAGTTRDLLRENLSLDGIAVTLVDTAGLRESADAVEVEGIRRARAEIERADVVLAMIDEASGTDRHAFAGSHGAQSADVEPVSRQAPGSATVIWLHGKSDLHSIPARSEKRDDGEHLWLSSLTGDGLDLLRERLRRQGGSEAGGSFSARARHLRALEQALAHVGHADRQLAGAQAELAAEELRQAQCVLGTITGPMDADALLGRIFAGFCIGK